MQRLVRLLPLAAVALCLSACAAELTSGNERGGLIAHVNGLNQDKAFKLAEAHCHKFGRVAQITSTDAIYNRARFVCVNL